MAGEKLVFNYNTEYTKAVDAEWVGRQFKIYDKFVREYYDPRNLLNNFDGTSYDSKGNIEYNIVHLGFVETLEGGNAYFRTVSIENKLKVLGKSILIDDVTMNRNASIAKNLTVDGELSVTKDTNLKSNLLVEKNANILKDLTVDGKLNVEKNTNLYSNLTVKGSSTFESVKANGKSTLEDVEVNGEFIKGNENWVLCSDNSLSSLII